MNTYIQKNKKHLLHFFTLIIICSGCDKEDTSSEDKLTPPFEVDKGNAAGLVQANYRQVPIIFDEYIEVRNIFPNEIGIEARNGNRILVIRFNRSAQDTVRSFFGTYHNANGLYYIEPEQSNQYLIIDQNNLDSNIFKADFAFRPLQRDTTDRISDQIYLGDGVIDISYEGL